MKEREREKQINMRTCGERDTNNSLEQSRERRARRIAVSSENHTASPPNALFVEAK